MGATLMHSRDRVQIQCFKSKRCGRFKTIILESLGLLLSPLLRQPLQYREKCYRPTVRYGFHVDKVYIVQIPQWWHPRRYSCFKASKRNSKGPRHGG
eukprot:scaffold14825_cov20-Cyclotella_meneghiniana.AAC.5